MDDNERYVGLSCGVGRQIKLSAHWHCFSLFINQIHHNECVCVSVCVVQMCVKDWEEKEDRW